MYFLGNLYKARHELLFLLQIPCHLSFFVLTYAFSNMNIDAKTGSTGGGSDTNILNKNGLKAVNLGIGMKNAHTLEEYIAIEDLFNSAIMVTEIIKEA